MSTIRMLVALRQFIQFDMYNSTLQFDIAIHFVHAPRTYCRAHITYVSHTPRTYYTPPCTYCTQRIYKAEHTNHSSTATAQMSSKVPPSKSLSIVIYMARG